MFPSLELVSALVQPLPCQCPMGDPHCYGGISAARQMLVMAGRGERRLRCSSAPGAVPCSPTAKVFVQGKHGLCLPRLVVQRVCTSRARGLPGTLPRTGEQHLSLPCGCQPGLSRDTGCWLRAVPGLPALPPARNAFESPCPEPGSGAGEDGQITSSWSQLLPHVVCSVGHRKPRMSGHALPFSPPPESSAGARPAQGLQRCLSPCQGTPHPVPGCCAVLRCA